MNQLLKPAAQKSCLVIGLVEWLRVLLDGEESLADWVLFEAQKKRHAVKAEEAEMLRHGDCSHHRQGFRREEDVDCFRLVVGFSSRRSTRYWLYHWRAG